jgi:hypothetical protein
VREVFAEVQVALWEVGEVRNLPALKKAPGGVSSWRLRDEVVVACVKFLQRFKLPSGRLVK